MKNGQYWQGKILEGKIHNDCFFLEDKNGKLVQISNNDISSITEVEKSGDGQ